MPEICRRGDHGMSVERLQRLLAKHGFDPGAIDGRFGPATEAALIGFQKSGELLPDGVAGAQTWRALDPNADLICVDCTDQLTVDVVAEMFPATPSQPIKRHLPQIISALRENQIIEKPLVLTAIATIRAESEGFEPINEMVSRYNTSPNGHPFDLYDFRADLGNSGPPDGAQFKGRGFVQLTGRDNYRRFGRAIGAGDTLVREPERANDPVFAARLLTTFIGSRASLIKRALLNRDLRRARALVNGGTHGIERFEDAYRTGCRLIDDPVWLSVA